MVYMVIYEVFLWCDCGEYATRDAVAFCSTKEKAEELLNEFQRDYTPFRGDEYGIAEHTLDELTEHGEYVRGMI
jgi:hypothetical protein